MQCPICQGEMWDNRAKKTNPKAPDYKCKDKSCTGVIWPPRDAKPRTAAAPMAHGPKWTWFKLAKTYEWALLSAEPRVIALGERLNFKITPEHVLQAAATVFIEACRSGVQDPKNTLPPKGGAVKPPEPEPEPEEFEEDGIPF